MSGLKDQDIAGELGDARRRYFERTLGKKIDSTLIGEDDLETSDLNQDLVNVTAELQNILRKSSQISDSAIANLQIQANANVGRKSMSSIHSGTKLPMVSS